MKILFIDDDKAPIRYYLEELKDAGFDVTHCRNPDEALDALEEEGLTTGNFLFRDIRERCPDTPILILTNFAGLDWIRKASECSNVCEVRKLDVMPFELVERVRQMIK